MAVSSPLFMFIFLREKSDGSLHADIDLLVIFAEIQSIISLEMLSWNNTGLFCFRRTTGRYIGS